MAARTGMKRVSVLRPARLCAVQAPAVGEDAATDGQRGGVSLGEQAAAVRQERPVRSCQPAIPGRQRSAACSGACTQQGWHSVCGAAD